MWVGPLVPGKYDVVIDMDKDGKYTIGTDYIDAGFTVRGRQVGAGFIVTGTFPPIRLALSANPPVINANERATILAQVQTDAGQFVSGATVNFSIVSGQGGQLSANSATTDQNGIATVSLTATQSNTNIVIRATVTHAGRSDQREVTLRVRAPGELGLTIR